MKTKYTAQDLIDVGADLFDNKGFTRNNIRIFLTALADNGYVAEGVDLEKVYDLIVG